MSEGSSLMDFIVMMKLTLEAAKGLRDPDQRVLEAIEAAANQALTDIGHGAHLLNFYVTTGSFDIVAIIAVPTEGDEMCFASKMVATGLVTTTTMRGYGTAAARSAMGHM